jgi:YD repeat-containing protein
MATCYTYDLLNNLTGVAPGAQSATPCSGATPTRTFSYSTLSRLTSATNPESSTVNYTYDNNGNIATVTDARGTVTTLRYDGINRVKIKTYTLGANTAATPNVRMEVYVRPFPPSAGGKWMVSSGGGSQPRWRRDGKELLYFSPGNRLMSVEVSIAGLSFKAGTPITLFTIPAPMVLGFIFEDNWDLTADGQRFLINTIEDSNVQPITVVLNWLAGLKK